MNMSDPAEEAMMPEVPGANPHLLTEAELDVKYPNRPRNTKPTLPFHELYTHLFNPLDENKTKPTGPGAAMARRKAGPHGQAGMAPHERRRQIIERFITRWREHVGPDIYPAFRLVLPDKDRDRPMYGLKEKAIGKLLVKAMRINPHSEDGTALQHFKLPGPGIAARMAGDFAGRCYEVLKKRPMRTEPGTLTVGEVNELLDQLAVEGKETGQLRLIEAFYQRMNPTEMMWLVRIMLRQMKVGATERTIFDLWHPDAVGLYNVTSSLRRVCWDLADPRVRLETADTRVALMQCFQPQLAQFQPPSFAKMVERLRPTADDDAFWIEEKLDGERMQMHMVRDPTHPGGRRFAFWSRKAKEYTYLYGDGLEDPNGALTRHLRDAFHEGVDNIILDGEMITWDPEQDKMVPFGTLKTAALAEQRSGANVGPRPLYAVFDLVYLNDTVLTQYTLRDRRRALEASVNPVYRRFQLHPYAEAHDESAIEPAFRRVVEEEAEGLVLKNPRAPYRPNERTDDWMKVKPDYLGFGETPDCVIIGGYYGSGRRGGAPSSFLCGLRLDRPGADPELCASFFKVGGGLSAQDYATIRHLTANKWQAWEPRRPPTQYILLGGADGAAQQPDVWIRPRDSVVVEVQAASAPPSDTFAAGVTLRFPRFRRLRPDRDWTSALSLHGFRDLKAAVDETARENQALAASRRPKRLRAAAPRPVTLADADADSLDPADPSAALHPADAAYAPTRVFAGLAVYVLSGTGADVAPAHQRTRAQLAALVRAHGGRIVATARPGALCIADRRVVHAAALQASGTVDLVRPRWLLDCVAAAAADLAAGVDPARLRPLPLDRAVLFHATLATGERAADHADAWGDSYARPADPIELRAVLDTARAARATTDKPAVLRARRQLRRQGLVLGAEDSGTDDDREENAADAQSDHEDEDEENAMDVDGPVATPSLALRRTALFAGRCLAFSGASLQTQRARYVARFAGASEVPAANAELVVVDDEPRGTGSGDDDVVYDSMQEGDAAQVRAAWVLDSWEAGQVLDVEAYKMDKGSVADVGMDG